MRTCFAHLSVRISASGYCMTTCAISLIEDVLCKMCVSGRRNTCASRATCVNFLYGILLCQMSVSRSPQNYLCKISICESLVQDFTVMMSASGSSMIPVHDLCVCGFLCISQRQDFCINLRTSCARSLGYDVCIRIL